MRTMNIAWKVPLFLFTAVFAIATIGCQGTASEASNQTSESTELQGPPAPEDYKNPPAEAVALKHGVRYLQLKAPTGDKAAQWYNRVTIGYTLWNAEGHAVEGTFKSKRPQTSQVSRNIPGLAQVLEHMKVGEKVRAWIPKDQGFEPFGFGTAGDLVYEVELMAITDGIKPIDPPADVGAVPADAKTTASGLAYRFLQNAGKGPHPKAADKVTVNYTGWTTDGRMFDSNIARGRTASFVLSNVIKGWTEGLQLMKAGDSARFWIPADLAYGEKPRRPGMPAGMLVFDVELLEIEQAPEPPKTPKDVAAVPSDAKKTASGLAYKVLKSAKGGKKPAATDRVTVHYTGWTTDGSMFDSSVTRQQPATFPLNGVIKGWTEGLQLMSEGESYRFWIPAALAYGENPGGGRPGGMLVFDVELQKVIEAPKPPQTPDDVAAVPSGAQKTSSGLAYRILKRGSAKDHPAATDRVTVHYSGWTTDGRMFDSSVMRGQPATFPLNGVIKGWTEGLQLMAEGDSYRFWIPAALAYGENPGGGRPGGMLVFDVELLKIN